MLTVIQTLLKYNGTGRNIMAHLRNREKVDQNSQLLPNDERRKQV